MLKSKRERSLSNTTSDKANSKKKTEEIIINNDFEQFGIPEPVQERLRVKEIISLFDVQKSVFKPVKSGKNVIVASLTGSGKTLSFVLPILSSFWDEKKYGSKRPRTLVIAPTRELCIQIGREFSDLSSKDFDFNVALIYGGVSIDDQIHKLKRGADIIVGTPGRLIDMIERGELNLEKMETVVLDEADKMLQMGFQESIEEIFKHIYKKQKRVQVCLFSATIASWVLDIAKRIMNKEEHVFIDLVKDLDKKTPKTVQHLAVQCINSERVTTIADLILCYGGVNKSTIVFVPKKSDCNSLMISDKIKQEVGIIHGDINQKQREATIEGFKKGKYKCLVATDVASRGLDIPMIDLVIQSEPPKEIDSYIHRAGRTARAGRSGICITLYTKMTEYQLAKIEKVAKIKFTRIGAPQKNELVEASIRDIRKNLDDIDESSIKLFSQFGRKIIEEYGAEEAISRLLAYVSGHTEKLRSRSLLCGAEGFVTYVIKCPSGFNHIGYIWTMLKRILTDEKREKVRGMKPFKTMDGVVFDYPEDDHLEFEAILQNHKTHGTTFTLEKPEKLPELADPNATSNSNNSSNYGSNRQNGNHGGHGNNNQSGGGSFTNYSKMDRHKRLDMFIGNLPFNVSEDKIQSFIENNGISPKDIEIRLVMDKETGEQKGFGFISTLDKNVYDKVLGLNGISYMGRRLKINASHNLK